MEQSLVNAKSKIIRHKLLTKIKISLICILQSSICSIHVSKSNHSSSALESNIKESRNPNNFFMVNAISFYLAM